MSNYSTNRQAKSIFPTAENSTFIVGMIDYKNDYIKPLKVGNWYSQQEATVRAKQLNEDFEANVSVKELGFDEFVAYNYYTDTTGHIHDWS
jgi:hypothetical protein